MKLKKPKTCGACRAFVPRAAGYGYCELGFRINTRRSQFAGIATSFPDEPCLKPDTIAEYFEARKERL